MCLYNGHSVAINNVAGECVCTGNVYFMSLRMTLQWAHLVKGKTHTAECISFCKRLIISRAEQVDIDKGLLECQSVACNV